MDQFFDEKIEKKREDNPGEMKTFKDNLKNIIEKLESLGKEKQFENLIKDNHEKMIKILEQKKNNLEEALKSQHYTKILDEINTNIKDNLSNLQSPINVYINNNSIRFNTLFNVSKELIDNFFNENYIKMPSDFQKYFSKNIGDSIEELYKDIIGSSETIVSIFKKKTFLETIKSSIFDFNYLSNIIDIIADNYLIEVKKKLHLLEEKFGSYIDEKISPLYYLLKTCEITFNKEQIKMWKELKSIYTDMKIKLKIEENYLLRKKIKRKKNKKNKRKMLK